MHTHLGRATRIAVLWETARLEGIRLPTKGYGELARLVIAWEGDCAALLNSRKNPPVDKPHLTPTCDGWRCMAPCAARIALHEWWHKMPV